MASFCTHCGQSLSFFERLRGLDVHPGCRRALEDRERERAREAELERQRQEQERKRQRDESFKQAINQINQGMLQEIAVPSGIVLHPGEKRYGLVKRCWRAQLYPSVVGRRTRPLGSNEIRTDGIVRKEQGDLLITAQRVLFVSPLTTGELQIKKVVQCTVSNDVLLIAASGRSTALRFIIPDAQYIKMIAALIIKLASMACAA